MHYLYFIDGNIIGIRCLAKPVSPIFHTAKANSTVGSAIN